MQYKTAHFVGIGGIHVSAVAKLLHARGVSVTGSDAVDHDMIRELRDAGIRVATGHAAANIPDECDVVVYSHAVPEDNPELAEAKRRGIRSFDTHRFLATLFLDREQIVVTGTHGKSTTASLVGLILSASGLDPTVVVGTKVPGFPDGNLRIGREDLLVVEGDEYREHVRSYYPTVMVLNNIELDHTDVYPDLESVMSMFAGAVDQIRDRGTLVYNVDDVNTSALVDAKRESLMSRGIRVLSVGLEKGDIQFSSPHIQNGKWCTHIRKSSDLDFNICLSIPGEMNTRNAAMASAAAIALGNAGQDSIASALADFPGCWRRFERVGETNGALVISDYGHHPTEIAATLKAARQSYPDRRIVLCFEPHQHNRTKHLFRSFIPAFNDADVLIISKIYDVPGRESAEDADISSSDLTRAVAEHDVERGVAREIIEAKDVLDAESVIRRIIKDGDIILVMGAGTIDQVARKLVV
jgi:UDP-N-acetylmuramate--alanine ligase